MHHLREISPWSCIKYEIIHEMLRNLDLYLLIIKLVHLYKYIAQLLVKHSYLVDDDFLIYFNAISQNSLCNKKIKITMFSFFLNCFLWSTYDKNAKLFSQKSVYTISIS